MKVFQSEDPVPRDSNALDAERLETRGDCAADATETRNHGRRALQVAAVLGKFVARPHGTSPEEPASPREKKAENGLGDDRAVERAEMNLDAFWRITPCHKFAPRRRSRKDFEFRRARKPLLLEVPDDGMCRRRERLQKTALAFDTHDATSLCNERPDRKSTRLNSSH